MNTYNKNTNYLRNIDHTNQNETSINIEKFSKNMNSNINISNESCRVCGFSKTIGRNFGVITCSTCKAFFRRNGRIGSSLPPCRFGGHCPVNERTRRQCSACRLAKCFAVGMQKDLIRTEEERAARLELVRANRLQRYEKYHRKNEVISSEQSYSNNDKSLASAFSSDDWVQLTNICNAYEHFFLQPILRSEEGREEYLISQPVKCRLKEHSFLNALKTRLLSLAAFFHATIPIFAIGMNTFDRQWLIRTNLYYLFPFSSMDLINTSGNQLYFDKNRACHNVYAYIYGQNLLKREQYLIDRLNNCIGFDPIISKVMQIILFLSPSLAINYLPMTNSYHPSLKTVIHIIYSQEQYIQLLWSYLVYHYGEMKAHKTFMLTIGQVLQQQLYAADADEKLLETQPFGNLIHSLLMTFSID